MNFTKYNEISFSTYQMDRPNLLDFSFIGNKDSQPFKKFLTDVTLIACEYTYNKKLTTDLSGHARTHSAYISITKHLCVVVSCEFESGSTSRISKMYLTDILLEKDPEENKLWIREIMSYKINNGNVPNMRCYCGSGTVGLWSGTRDTFPDKLPVIGFGENKLFIPQRSSFLEGPHVNLYKQNFDFDYYPYGTITPVNLNGENLASNPKNTIQLREIN